MTVTALADFCGVEQPVITNCRHFRYIFRRRRFRPSNQGNDEQLALLAVTTEQVKQRQKDEVKQLVGEISLLEKERLEAAKQESLQRFWEQGEQ